MNPTSQGRGSLAAVEVRLERRTELLCALALAAGETTTALAGGGEATGRTAAVAVVAVRPGEHAELLVGDNCGVVGVDEDDLVVLVLPILADPIGVQDLEVGVVAGAALFGDALLVLGHGDLGDTGLGRLALHVDLALAKATTANTGTNEDNALLGFVTKSASGVDSGWSFDSSEDWLPSPSSHSFLTEHVRKAFFRLLPSLSNIVINTLCHNEHLLFERLGDLPTLYESIYAIKLS